MSNRSLLEINHDFGPRTDDECRVFGRMIRTYLGSGDPKDLPRCVTWKHTRHHSEPEPSIPPPAEPTDAMVEAALIRWIGTEWPHDWTPGAQEYRRSEMRAALAAALAVAPWPTPKGYLVGIDTAYPDGMTAGEGAPRPADDTDDPIARLITPVPGATGYDVWSNPPGEGPSGPPDWRYVIEPGGTLRRVEPGDGVAGE